MTQISLLSRNEVDLRKFTWPDFVNLTSKHLDLYARLPSVESAFVLKINDLALKLYSNYQITESRKCLRTTLRFKGRKEYIHIWQAGPEFLQYLVGSLAPDVELAGLSSSTASLVLEHLFTAQLRYLEEKIGFGIEVVEHGFANFDNKQLCIGIDIEYSKGDISTVMIEGDAKVLASVFDLIPKPKETRRWPSVDKLPVSISIRSPEYAMPRYQFELLSIGDGIILESDWQEFGTQQVIISGYYPIKVKGDKGTLVLDGPLKSVPDKIDGDNNAESAPRDLKSYRKTVMNTNSNSNTIEISLELAKREISFSDLSKLKAGSVLPFSDELPKKVGLIVQNQKIGEGELVRVDDTIAVLVTKID